MGSGKPMVIKIDFNYLVLRLDQIAVTDAGGDSSARNCHCQTVYGPHP